MGTTPVGDDAADQPLIWMRFAADAKVDDQATIRDLMGDLDTYARRKFSVAGVEIDLVPMLPCLPTANSRRGRFRTWGCRSRQLDHRDGSP